MSGLFNSIRFALALLTVIAIVAKPFIPPRTLLLFPIAKNTIFIHGPNDAEGNPNIRWIDKDNASSRCDHKQRSTTDESCAIIISWIPDAATATNSARFPACVYGISDPDGDGWGWENEQTCVITAKTLWDSKPQGSIEYPICKHATSDPDGDGWGWEGDRACQVKPEALKDRNYSNERIAPPASIDTRSYDGFLIDIDYEGRADYIRLNLRDAGAPALTRTGTEKFMSALVRTEDLRIGPVTVGFNAFAVDEWWVFQENPPRQKADSELGHLVQVGFHYPEFGVHRMTIKEIKLVGQRISNETYLMAIMLVWIAYLLTEAGVHYRLLTHSMQGNLNQLQKLVRNANKLEQEKHHLKNRSITDPLTGVNNRNGLIQQLQEQYNSELLPQSTGVVVMDIDHFKALNDTHGHDAGDQVLMNFATQISQAVRSRDVFARWGGEEFVLIVDTTSPENLRFICEKLRQLVADSHLLPNSTQAVTVSMGAVLTDQVEHFDTAFKRADTALYRAKTQRNQVAYGN